MKTAYLAALIGIALALPATVEAKTPTATVIVRHTDLDLTTPDGLDTLKRRVRRAVREVCSDPFYSSLEQSNCLTETQRIADRDIERARRRTLALLSLPTG